MTNAEIGAIHEFGTLTKQPPIQPRSFLRVPLEAHRGEIVADTAKRSEQFIVKGDIVGLMKRMGAAGVKVVMRAFQSSGDGKWPPLKPSTIAHRKKKSDKPLIDTGELRRSISYSVEKK